jgi:hypothetical protein
MLRSNKIGGRVGCAWANEVPNKSTGECFSKRQDLLAACPIFASRAASIRALAITLALVGAAACTPPSIDEIVRVSESPGGMPDPLLQSRLPGGYDEALRDSHVLGPHRQARLRCLEVVLLARRTPDGLNDVTDVLSRLPS